MLCVVVLLLILCILVRAVSGSILLCQSPLALSLDILGALYAGFVCVQGFELLLSSPLIQCLYPAKPRLQQHRVASSRLNLNVTNL